MTFKELVHYRRSIRYYKEILLDTDIVKQCLELVVLAPNNSNI